MIIEDSQRNAEVRTRPIRVAFLVELNDSSQAILTAIFQACFQFWGGRFSLIVPYEKGALRATFLSWLKYYDPDIIYSYVDLSEAEQLRLHEDIYPSYLVRHHDVKAEDGVDPRSWRPSLPVVPLGIATLLPLLARRSVFGPPSPLKLVTALGDLGNSEFLIDNFGTHDNVVERRAVNDLSQEIKIVAVCGDDVRPEHSRHAYEQITSVAELLTRLGGRQNMTSLAQLSAILTPRPDMHAHPWSQTFNLVVGDTVADRLLYWNLRSLYPVWRDGSPVDLRVPTKLFADVEFRNALLSYLKGIPSVSGNNSGGNMWVTLRSVSLSIDQLDVIKTQLAQSRSWIGLHIETVPSVDGYAPEELREHGRGYEISPASGLSTGRWTARTVMAGRWHLTSDVPEHLRHAPVTFQSEAEGLWAVDLNVERRDDHSPYDNVRDRWRLPRRLRVTNSFVRSYHLTDHHGPTLVPRVSRHGLLTLLTGGTGSLPVIYEPADHDAVVGGLAQGRDWLPFARYKATQPVQICYAAERSDAGRHFWGVYQLFGGLGAANSFLMSRFWRTQLAEFGATDQRPERRLDAVKSRLRKRMPKGQIDLSDDKSLGRLADIVQQEADGIRLSIDSISWDKLRTDHETLINADWERSPGDDDSRVETMEWDRRSLAPAVQSLCERGILYQGRDFSCRRCHHKSWISIAELKMTIVCEVCKHTEPAPVDGSWNFRLNGFLREALRRHGVGPLFWALSKFRNMTSPTYWFEGPLGIYFDKESVEAGERDTDIDLTIVSGEQVRMCEVKQSARGFREPEKYAAHFRRLRPDIATIAIMEPMSDKIAAAFAKFEAELVGDNIKAELLTFDPENDIEDRGYLDRVQRVRLL